MPNTEQNRLKRPPPHQNLEGNDHFYFKIIKTHQVTPAHNYACIRNLGRRISNDPGKKLGKLHGQRLIQFVKDEVRRQVKFSL